MTFANLACIAPHLMFRRLYSVFEFYFADNIVYIELF